MATRSYKTIFSPLWGKPLDVPGFVSVEDMRQVGDWGLVEMRIRYNDAQLHTVTRLQFTSSVEVVGVDDPDAVEVGLITMTGGMDRYISYRATELPEPPHSTPKTLVVRGALSNELDFYVKGLVSVDEVRVVDDWWGVEVFVTYHPLPESPVEHVRVHAGDIEPVTAVGGTSLGTIHSDQHGWRHVYYTHTPVPDVE
ncbi:MULTISPECIES: hypothetical protein [unclassified Nocardia]|uniref:hypothetical protein n=1 Tax=unclassified Nocardia TaxID=2637762 RepID=UPI00278C0C7D|nr:MULTISPECIES: hypothetical protein [unclassified Nocardia]